MKIVSDIIDAYLNNALLQNYKSHWIFEEIGRGDLKGKNTFYEPSYEQAFRESVSNIAELIKNELTTFVPSNAKIWDSLFSNWREIINNVDINLIIGLPEPYDSTVLESR